MRLTRRHFFVAVINITFSAIVAQAQINDSGLFWHNEIDANFHFQTWGKKNDRITQFSMPILYVLPLNLQTTIDVSTGLAFSQRTTASRRLDGPIDTRVRFTHRAFQESLLLSAFISVPTGSSRLKGDQNEVASALSDDALNFQVPNYGHGIHVNLAAVYAQQIIRGFVIGAGFAYLLKDSFQPFAEDELEYVPGDEMTFTLGFDLGGKKFKMSTDASYFVYKADKINDEKVFRSGNKLFLHSRLIYNTNPVRLTIYARNRSKGKNERGIGLLGDEARNSNGKQLDVGGIASIAVGKETRLLILAGSKFYAKNEFGDRGARIFSVGGGLQHRLSRKFSYQSSVRISSGELRSDDRTESVTGVEIGGGIIVRL